MSTAKLIIAEAKSLLKCYEQTGNPMILDGRAVQIAIMLARHVLDTVKEYEDRKLDSIARLRVWVRDCGPMKRPEFIADVNTVLDMAEIHCFGKIVSSEVKEGE